MATYEFSSTAEAYDFYLRKFADPDYDPYYDEDDR